MSPDEAAPTITENLQAEMEARWQLQLIYLGQVVGQAVMLERALDQAFCALVGSKFAAVVSGGQGVAWMIDYCEVLTKAHTELFDQNRQAIAEALAASRAANKKRNDLVHSIIFPGGPNTPMQAVKSQRKTYKQTLTPWTVDEMRGVAVALIRAEHQLAVAVENALGKAAMSLSDQLRAENS